MNNQYVARLSTYEVSRVRPDYIVHRFLIPDLKSAIAQYASGRVLDIGCGNKPYQALFKPHTTEYIGCDIQQSNLELVDIICPAADIPLESGSFQTIFCTQVLEHVPSHLDVFKEAYRLLAPGGYFIASVPMYWPHHEAPYDFFRFTRFGIRQLLQTTGFEEVEIKSNGGKWALLGQVITLTFGKGKNNTLLTKIKVLLFKLSLAKYIIGFIFPILDRISGDDSDTLNFVFVGKKL